MKYKLDKSETFREFAESLDEVDPELFDDCSKEQQKRDILAKFY